MKILLIGLGRHGMRHAESLIKNKSTELHIVDTEGLTAKISTIESQNVQNKNIYGYSSLKQFFDTQINVDLSIIATSSEGRFELLQECIEANVTQKFILEKLIAPNIASLEKYKNYIFHDSLDIYVNCPQRTYPFYTNLLSEGEKIISAEYYGFKHIGLCSNLLHYVDLLEQLTGQAFSCGTAKNLHTRIESKRSGFSEYLGEVQVNIGNVKFTFLASEQSKPQADFHIKTNLQDYHMDYIKNVAYCDGKPVYNNFMLNQSDTTFKICQDALANKSKIPSLRKSIGQHEKVITMLEDRHYELNQNIKFLIS